MTYLMRTAMCVAVLALCIPALARKGGGRDDAGRGDDVSPDQGMQMQRPSSPVAVQPPISSVTPAPVNLLPKEDSKRGPKPRTTPMDAPTPVIETNPVSDTETKHGKHKPPQGRRNDDTDARPPTPVATVQIGDIPPGGAVNIVSPQPMPPATLYGTGAANGERDTPATPRRVHAGARKHPTATELATPSVSPTAFVPQGPPPATHPISSGQINPLLPHSLHGVAGPNAPNRKPQKAAPTPGATPVPTPATATPTPATFHPGKHWKPVAGWTPPPGWKPPAGWTPPGGWVVPPGWRPPKGWTLKLSQWGWIFVPKRGWVVPPRWTPPPTFVTPPGWYYLPQEEYVTYHFCDPAIVEIVPGVARVDLIQPIEESEPYTPSNEVSEAISDIDEDSEEMDIVERPVPEEAPALQLRADIDQIVRELSRGRDPENRYAGPVVATQLVQFEDDGYGILPQSFAFLDALGEALLEPSLEDSVVSIEAHTNGTIADEDARVLTERRAWAVKGYLVQKFGIDPNRIRYAGYGNDAPIAPHDTDDGLAMNERLEIENITDLFGDNDGGQPTSGGSEDESTSGAATETAPVRTPGIRIEMSDPNISTTAAGGSHTSDSLSSSTLVADSRSSGTAGVDKRTTISISFP